MKRIINLIVLLALATLLSACESEPRQRQDAVSFTLDIGPDQSSKSQFSGSGNEVNCYRVFVYSGSTQKATISWEAGNDVPSMTLPAGNYTFYVLCNLPDVNGLGSSPDSFRLSYGSASQICANGLPMATKQAVTLSPDIRSLKLEVRRLVSKYNLYVQRDFEDVASVFTVTQVRICQSAGDVQPFVSGSRASEVLPGSSGDYCSSADLSCLNAVTSANSITGPVSFYMLENAGGTLLPGNTDPWKKCYDSYGGLLSRSQSSTLTYLELRGNWSTAGASETVTYRMYLGKDNCTNFDILRNTESNVTLSLTDTGKSRQSWKVTEESYTDNRQLAWNVPSLKMHRSGSYSASLSVNPPGMSYKLQYIPVSSPSSSQVFNTISDNHIGVNDAEKCASLDYSISSGLLNLSATTSPSVNENYSFAVLASTLDGKKSARLDVVVAASGELVIDLSADGPSKSGFSAPTDINLDDGCSVAFYSGTSGNLLASGSCDGSASRVVITDVPSEDCNVYAVGNIDVCWPGNESSLQSMMLAVDGLPEYLPYSTLRGEYTWQFGTSAMTVLMKSLFSKVVLTGDYSGLSSGASFVAESAKVTGCPSRVNLFTSGTSGICHDGQEAAASDMPLFNAGDGLGMYVPSEGTSEIQLNGLRRIGNGFDYHDSYTLSIPSIERGETASFSVKTDGVNHANQSVTVVAEDTRSAGFNAPTIMVVGDGEECRASVKGVAANGEQGWDYVISWTGESSLLGKSSMTINGKAYDLGVSGNSDRLPGDGSGNDIVIVSTYDGEDVPSVTFNAVPTGAATSAGMVASFKRRRTVDRINYTLPKTTYYSGESLTVTGVTKTMTDGTTVPCDDFEISLQNVGATSTVSGHTIEFFTARPSGGTTKIRLITDGGSFQIGTVTVKPNKI